VPTSTTIGKRRSVPSAARKSGATLAGWSAVIARCRHFGGLIGPHGFNASFRMSTPHRQAPRSVSKMWRIEREDGGHFKRVIRTRRQAVSASAIISGGFRTRPRGRPVPAEVRAPACAHSPAMSPRANRGIDRLPATGAASSRYARRPRRSLRVRCLVELRRPGPARGCVAFERDAAIARAKQHSAAGTCRLARLAVDAIGARAFAIAALITIGVIKPRPKLEG